MSDFEQQERNRRYNHDDEAREREGVTGVTKRGVDAESEDATTRHELARRAESLAVDAQGWLDFTADEDAQEIVEMIVTVAERLGEPPEDTDPETPYDAP